MWVVIYGRHHYYVRHKEHRFETTNKVKASIVYVWYYFRYIWSIYPVKYVKMYKVDGDVPKLGTYRINYSGRKGKRDD